MGYDLQKVPAQAQAHTTYQEYLDRDRHEPARSLREVGNTDLGIADVDKRRYIDRAWYEQEKKIWDHVWQVACREEHIPEPGDFHVYDIGTRSYLIVRTTDGGIKAYPNACLHRGRKLRLESGHGEKFRCPFHGFTWTLEGEIAHVPCEWDFPQVTKDGFNLPEVHVGTFAGWVFINPDPDAMRLEDFLDPIWRHYQPYAWDQSYLGVHAGKVLKGNWKIIQEAFMEAFHSLDTHPQILGSVDDFGCQYDVWEGKPHVNRMMAAFAVPSSYVVDQVTQQDVLDEWLGRKWDDKDKIVLAAGETARTRTADLKREQTEAQLGYKVPELSDAELVDGWYYVVFPNFMLWGGFGPNMWYRFRPWNDSHEETLMEVGYIMRHPSNEPKPAPMPMIMLDINTKWDSVEALGGLGFVLDQDTTNMAAIHDGLKASFKPGVTLASYQEKRIRHFHQTLDMYMERYANA